MSQNPIWDLTYFLLISTIVIWYIRATKNVEISTLRKISFFSANFLLAIVLIGPLQREALHYFWVHMVQHILIMMLISPLLILGSPIKLLLLNDGKVGALARKVSKVFFVRFLFKPHIGFSIFLISLIATHFSILANAAMNNSNLHNLELIIFLTAGLIYYYPVLEGNPTPYFVPHSVRVLSLFAMMLPETMIGFFLYSGNVLLHSAHQHDHMMNMGGLTQLQDQHIGGALMWSMGMVIDSIWIALAAKDWFANEKKLSGDLN